MTYFSFQVAGHMPCAIYILSLLLLLLLLLLRHHRVRRMCRQEEGEVMSRLLSKRLLMRLLGLVIMT